MMTKSTISYRKAMLFAATMFLAASVAVFGQEAPPNPPQNPPNAPQSPADAPPNPADAPQNPAAGPQNPPDAPQNPADAPQNPPPPADQHQPGWHKFSPPPDQPGAPEPPAPLERPAPPDRPARRAEAPPLPVPESITIPAGTFVTVRLDQFLSSDKNHDGDAFSATLARPLIADGLVVARRGQVLGGHVIEAKKAGRVKGVSHLEIEMNSITLADGEQVPVKTALSSISGPTSNGRDAGAIVTTTAAGSMIGAAADWGTGAAIGAGAGLVAGVVGVLVTRGRPTIIYPESQLTFRLAKPVTFSTERAPQAFIDARSLDTQRAGMERRGPPPGYRGGCPGPGCGGPYPPPAPYYYGYGPYAPYFWGPSFGFYYGGGFGRGYYGRR